MIPLRIAVEGFLCYRAEQEIRFEEAALWMLAGLNGSGKSAVFDGVTYALFGGHRAGKEHAEELINKNCENAAVEFDFLLDGQRYQARRTLRRKKQGGAASTQQISRWLPPQADAPGRWEAVPDTNLKRNFDAWVRDNIGLNYETFTSSVLLMQGKAEKLLAAGPKERFDVLAGIVDLERYQRLHERADDKRRRHKEQVDLLQRRLDEVPEMNAVELEQVEQQILTVRQVVETIRTEGERLQRLELQAERWQELQARLADTRQQWQQAEKLLAEGDAIEHAAARLQELRDVLPHLTEMVEQRQRLVQSLQVSTALVEEQRDLARRKGEAAVAIEQTRQTQHVLQQAIAADQQRMETIGDRLRELSGFLERVRFCEQQRLEMARIDAALAELPADPAGALSSAEQEHDRLQLLGQALPLLIRLTNARQELGAARRLHANLIAAETTATGEVERQTADCTQLAAQLEASIQVRQEADDRATAARTLWEQACRQLEQLYELSGSKVCRLCGQELTPGHVGEEREKREKIRAAAEVKAGQTETARSEAIAAEKQARLGKEKAEAALAGSRERLQDCCRRLAEIQRDIQRHIEECNRLHGELPAPYRQQVSLELPADWLETTYPNDNDLSAAREGIQTLPAALAKLRQAQAVQDQCKRLQAEREATQRALKTQETGLPADAAGLMEEHRGLETEDSTLKAALQTGRAQLEIELQALERLHRDHQTIGEQLADKGQQWTAEEVRREESQKVLERARAALPDAWQSAAETAANIDLERWQTERNGLEQQRVAARWEELAQARAGSTVLQQRLQELQEECDQIPVEARAHPDELKGRRQTARQEQADREAELHNAERTRERLVERQEVRRQLQVEHAEQDRQHNRYRLLAELLGRNRLQLYLVRRAERGIVDYANAVLDRLSDGQLYLRLGGDETGTDQALQLEAYNRTTGQEAIGVAFLSGSQRFRVAVSLALGIGQYASRQHRPIESVIIDEGFGCLDRQGRQVMIQELQNLRGQLRCILLVSHQEEFAEAFADVYRFELSNGSTQVKRWQR